MLLGCLSSARHPLPSLSCLSLADFPYAFSTTGPPTIELSLMHSGKSHPGCPQQAVPVSK